MSLNLQPPVTTWERFPRKRTSYIIGNSSKRASHIRDANGTIIKDVWTRLQRWAEYFEGLPNADEPEETLDFSAYAVSEDLDINMEPLLVWKNLKKLSVSWSGTKSQVWITSLLIKDGGKAVREWLCAIWVTKVFPTRWSPRGGGSMGPQNKKTTFAAEFCDECHTLYSYT